LISSPLPLASPLSGSLFIGIHIAGLRPLGVTPTHSSTFIEISGSLLWGNPRILALLFFLLLPSRYLLLMFTPPNVYRCNLMPIHFQLTLRAFEYVPLLGLHDIPASGAFSRETLVAVIMPMHFYHSLRGIGLIMYA
jgi:hypothetical protein